MSEPGSSHSVVGTSVYHDGCSAGKDNVNSHVPLMSTSPINYLIIAPLNRHAAISFYGALRCHFGVINTFYSHELPPHDLSREMFLWDEREI